MDQREKVIQLVSRLGLNELCRHVSPSLLDAIEASGVSISAQNVSTILVDEFGVDVFQIDSLRAEFLNTLDSATLSHYINECRDHTGSADISAFKWGKNLSTEVFLGFFGLQSQASNSPEKKLSSVTIAKPKQPLHHYQESIRRLSLSRLRIPGSKFILHMPTGAGKTRTAIEIICDFFRSAKETDVSVVWFAHSEELCEQACQTFESLWLKNGSFDVSTVRLWGRYPSPTALPSGPSFVVTSFATAYNLLRSRQDQKFALAMATKRQNKLTFVDEAHQATAPTYSEAIELFSSKDSSVIGLTATPGRHGVDSASDEQTQELHQFFDDGIIGMMEKDGAPMAKPISYLTSEGFLSEVHHIQLSSKRNFELSSDELKYIERELDVPSALLKRIGSDVLRTQLVAAAAADLATNEKKQVIVFAPSKDNAVALAALLRSKGVQARSVTGDTDPKQRTAAIESFREGGVSVLTNYGVLTTGFDSPNIEAVIVARPTTSVVLYSQMVGRGLRGPRMGGTESCKVIDVIDNIESLPLSDQAFNYFTHQS